VISYLDVISANYFHGYITILQQGAMTTRSKYVHKYLAFHTLFHALLTWSVWFSIETVNQTEGGRSKEVEWVTITSKE